MIESIRVGYLATALVAALPGLASGAEDAVPVTVTQVRAESMAPAVPAAGTVFSRNEGQITAGISARLEWIAEPGDFVAAGEPVARFDCGMLRLQREEQVAMRERERVTLTGLERELERLSNLEANYLAAATELDRLRTDRDLARTSVRILGVRISQFDRQLERCVAVAPFAGVVTERLHRAGEDVERSTPLASMTDTQHLEVRASVPVRYLPRVAIGEAADVRIAGLHLPGVIRKVVPAADALSQTFELRVDLPEAAPRYVATGQLVSVTFPLTATAALTVPRDAVVLREDGAFVMRINSRREAEQVAVDVADASGERIAVRGELKAGDDVAVRGAEALGHGQAVAIQSDT